MPAKKKKAAEEAWESPAPSDYLECPGAMMPAVRGEELKKLKKFKKTTVSKMETGQAYYLIYDVDEEPWGHFCRPIEIAGKSIRIHFANCDVITGAEHEEPEMFLDMEATCPDVAYIIPTEHIARIARAVAVDEKKIKEVIEADKTIRRVDASENRSIRVDMLVNAVCKVLLVNPKELGQAAKSPEAMGALMIVYVDEAIAEICQKRQAVYAESEELANYEAPTFGLSATNYTIAAAATMKILNPKPQQPHDQELAISMLEMRKEMMKEFSTLKQQIGMNAIVNPKPAEAAKALEKRVGMESMDGSNEDCCYHGGAVICEVSKDPSASLDTIFKMASAPLVKEAKQHLMKNFISIHSELEKIAFEIDGEHFASAKWKQTLGMTPDAMLNEVVEGNTQGGIVSLGLIAHHTDAEVTVVHEESINAQASDEQVQVGIHPAMLGSLPPGPVKKTRRVFVVLRRKHYYVAYIKQGDKKKATFDIGEEADEAQALLVAFLKSQKKGPLGQLGEADRRQAIAKALEQPKAVSWANVAAQNKQAPAPAPAGQKNGPPVEDLTQKENELCRNYEKDQQCGYGEKCKYKHDDSRKGRNRRKRKRQQAEAASIIKESRSRDRQPAKRGDHKRSGGKSRSPSRTRSRSRSNSGSRSRGSSPRGRSRSRSSRSSSGRSPSSKGRFRSRSSSASSSPQPRKTQWTTVNSRKVQLRVRCRKSVHPGAWRNSLQSISKAAHSLVTWAERDPTDKEWLQVQCEPDEVDKLEKLLRQDFTVERQRRRPNKDSKRRTLHCADFLNGDRCTHDKPYCK
jgi:hypothetical protein